MTSRVQKGGAIFRPVAKSRTPRQPSVAVDSSQISLSSDAPSTQAPSLVTASHNESPLTVSRSSVLNANPIPSSSNPPTNTSSSYGLSIPARNTPAPPTLISRAKPQTPAPTAPPSIHVHNFSNEHSSTSRSQEPVTPLNVGTVVHDPNLRGSIIVTSHDPTSTLGLTQQADSRPHKRALREGLSPAKLKRKVSTTSDAESSEISEPSGSKRVKRAQSGTPRPRRSRGPSLPPYDPDADPGDEIDPTVVTMASLCNDTGQGRVSRKALEILSNHAAWKSQNREKRARMKTLMELKKYGREAEVEALETNTAPIPEDASQQGLSAESSDSPAVVDNTGSGFDYTEGLETSRYNVQVRIGPNGETMIDEESLVVDRNEGEDTANYTHVVESDHTKFVNSGTYGKRYRGSRWSVEETELFYSALAQYGENYELIAYVLPGRDRKSCKNKFKAEDKKNPARINHCLSNNIPVDVETLSRMTGKDFSGPVPEIRPSARPEGEEEARQER